MHYAVLETGELCAYTDESRERATKLLEMIGSYGVPEAPKLWAGLQGAINLESDEEEEKENAAHGSDKERSRAVTQPQPHLAPSDVARTMYRSSYGRIVKSVKRASTLSATSLKLPRIVVVGSESAGKSSTLERIAGVSLFPRDAKICTRMPIRLSLINDDDAPRASVTLKFPGREDQSVHESQAAAAIGKLMRQVVPPGSGVIDTELTVEIRKASVPTLDLIDLPGIVAASIEGEPADMMQKTRAITERYLRDSNTIVVAVVPANITRVRDSQAIQLVQACGKEAMTLGVLAKADLAHDPRYKQRKQRSPYWELEQRLSGESDDIVDLPNGWVAVKNRDTLVQEEEAGGLVLSSQTERDWFANEASFGQIDSPLSKSVLARCGLDALLTKIDHLYTSHIKMHWVPQAIAKLESEMAVVNARIETLGPAPGMLSLDDVLTVFLEEFQTPDVLAMFDTPLRLAADSLVSAAIETLLPSDKAAVSSAAAWGKPTLQYVIAKAKVVAALEREVELVATMPKAASATFDAVVLYVFERGGSHPMHLDRFEVLRAAVLEAFATSCGEHVEDYELAVKSAIKARAQSAADGADSSVGPCMSAMPRIIAEVALRELVADILMDPAKIILSLNELNASAKARAKGTKRARTDAMDVDGDAAGGLPTAHALLVESCAAARAELAKTKHDLFVALGEIRKI